MPYAKHNILIRRLKSKERTRKHREAQKIKSALLLKNYKNREAIRKHYSSINHAKKRGKYKPRKPKYKKIMYAPIPKGARMHKNPNFPYYFLNGRAIRFKVIKEKLIRHTDYNIMYKPEILGLKHTPQKEITKKKLSINKQKDLENGNYIDTETGHKNIQTTRFIQQERSTATRDSEWWKEAFTKRKSAYRAKK